MRSWGTVLQWSGVATAPSTLAAVRTGVGTVMLLAPHVLPSVLGVDASARSRTSWLVQMLGTREIALGAGMITADRPAAARSWAAAGGACDVLDALVVAAAVRRGAVSGSWGSAVALSALAAGVVGLVRSRP